MGNSLTSVSRMGTTEDFDLQVSRGHIPFHTTLFKYGYNPLIVNANETIWDVGGLYSYPSSALTMTATSTSAGTDEDVEITVTGLDADYNEVTQTKTLNSSGVAVLDTELVRVYRAYVSGSQAPVGSINIASGGTTYARITAGENQTLMAVYTVPAGYTLYITQGVATHGTDTSGAFMTVRFKVKSFGGVFRTATKIDIIGSEILFPFKYPLKVTEKSDIEVQAICSKNQNNAIAATFEGILVKN